MNLTVKFDGHVSDVIDRLVEKGVVSTKTEALRLGVLRLEAEYLKDGELERRFDEKMVKEIEKYDKLKEAGKIKTYNEEEFYKLMGWKPRSHRKPTLQKDKKRQKP